MRTLSWILALSVVTAPALGAYDAEAVQRAIRQQGKRWQAGDTALTRMRDQERARRSMPRYPFPSGFALPAGGWHEPSPVATWASVTDAFFSWADREGLCYLTPVRDQGDCGSCFVFGSLAVTEAQYRIVRDEPGLDLDLAEQELISCIAIDDCDTGGTAEQVGEYLKEQGVPAESCFPYTSGATGNDGQCADSCADGGERRYFIRDWDMSTLPWTTDELKAQLLIAPIIANLQIYSDFYAYAGGVYSRTSDSARGWHIVALIGWDDADESWLIKNSWGTDWGLQGYGKIARGERECVPTYPLGTFDGTCFASHTTTFDVTLAQTGTPGTDAGLVTTDAAVSPDSGTGVDVRRPDSAIADAVPGSPDRVSSDSAVVGADAGGGDAASTTRMDSGETHVPVDETGCGCVAARSDLAGAWLAPAFWAPALVLRRRRSR